MDIERMRRLVNESQKVIAAAAERLTELGSALDDGEAAEVLAPRFDVLYPRLREIEGGYTPDRTGGGHTNRGITLNAARAYWGEGFSVIQLKALTDEQTKDFYLNAGYWRFNAQYGCQDLPKGLDWFVFDSAVHSGKTRAVMWLQAALGVADDGVLGPITVKAAREDDPGQTISMMRELRWAFMRKLTNFGENQSGWENRLDRVEGEALSDASGPRGWGA